MVNVPAFPSVEPATTYKTTVVNHGMTLRDYFAGRAMQGMLCENSGIRYPTPGKRCRMRISGSRHWLSNIEYGW